MPAKKKLLIVDVAALGWSFVSKHQPFDDFTFHRAETVFPAVTCPVQASFRTATRPDRHGMVGNGLFFNDLKKVLFWEQSASLVAGERIWKKMRERGKRVGMMFWQQSLGEEVDLVLSPKPIHKHEGGMIQDCYSQPPDLYDRLKTKIRRSFNLMHYWGPLASAKSSEWITDATIEVMRSPEWAPDVLFSYLPHLDYDLQRYGPESRQAEKAFEVLVRLLEKMKQVADENGYEYLFFGDYAMEGVQKYPIYPNRLLREEGFFHVRKAKGMAYPDFFSSAAFAVVDHQVAHIYTKDTAATRRAKELLVALPGVARVLDRHDQEGLGVQHGKSGDLVAIAEKGAWFAYPWWTNRSEAPDFATHVDIHNKPGYDPCELFFGWPPLSVSMNANKIRGTHGRVDEDLAVAWATSLALSMAPKTLAELASCVREWMDKIV